VLLIISNRNSRPPPCPRIHTPRAPHHQHRKPPPPSLSHTHSSCSSSSTSVAINMLGGCILPRFFTTLCFLVYLVDVRTEKLMKKIVSMCDAYVICITTAVFNVTYAILGRKHLLPEFWEELEKYSLQNLALWIFEERQRFRKGNAGQNSASLTLVGRDCDTLLDYMKQILSNLKQMFPSATEQLDILLELWKTYTILFPTKNRNPLQFVCILQCY
jgi:hypothetical protein